ncbi:class I SAM-dependent methyltransferase [Halobellus rufus]|uniref:class I SAM-dependent methyltransferase n=1 Tax=Halobellus rufus TaxID=1448860 RepID=UPI00067857F0|nr:methyltransferase domain-containing protein [Halobellus rufus]
MGAPIRPPTFADACAAVLEDPDAGHGADTTLAPVVLRTIPDGWGERRARLVASRLPADVDRVLELGCGVGALLNELGSRYAAVGVDARRAHLRFPAALGEAVVCGDPTNPPVRSAFDAVCAVETATARADVADVCTAAYRSLRPGGIAVIAAPTDPSAVLDSGVETYSGSRYLLERAVDVAGSGSVAVDYRVTDRETGSTAVVADRTTVATTTVDGLTAALGRAGFEHVLVAGESDLPGVVVGRAVRPVETSAPAER